MSQLESTLPAADMQRLPARETAVDGFTVPEVLCHSSSKEACHDMNSVATHVLLITNCQSCPTMSLQGPDLRFLSAALNKPVDESMLFCPGIALRVHSALWPLTQQEDTLFTFFSQGLRLRVCLPYPSRHRTSYILMKGLNIFKHLPSDLLRKPKERSNTPF